MCPVVFSAHLCALCVLEIYFCDCHNQGVLVHVVPSDILEVSVKNGKLKVVSGCLRGKTL